MTRLNLIGALAAAGAALLLALGPTSATEYSNNPNPACRTMRNNTPGLPFPPEPNREDTRKAQLLWGGDPSFLGNSPYARKQYGQAFALLQKVDGEGTDALAALPPNTPRIDLVIDRHVSNLMVARLMVAAFYEQGRLGNPDPAQAAAFYQKAIDTNYTDDRGCVHATPIIDAMRNRYVAVLVYDLRTPEAHAKALDVLRDGGPKFESALYLLGKNMLPMQRYEYFEADLDAMAEDLRHPPPTQADLILALLARIALWCAIALVLVVGAVGVARAVRRRLGYKDEASLYRTVFAVYDALRHVVARLSPRKCGRGDRRFLRRLARRLALPVRARAAPSHARGCCSAPTRGARPRTAWRPRRGTPTRR